MIDFLARLTRLSPQGDRQALKVCLGFTHPDGGTVLLTPDQAERLADLYDARESGVINTVTGQVIATYEPVDWTDSRRPSWPRMLLSHHPRRSASAQPLATTDDLSSNFSVIARALRHDPGPGPRRVGLDDHPRGLVAHLGEVSVLLTVDRTWFGGQDMNLPPWLMTELQGIEEGTGDGVLSLGVGAIWAARTWAMRFTFAHFIPTGAATPDAEKIPGRGLVFFPEELQALFRGRLAPHVHRRPHGEEEPLLSPAAGVPDDLDHRLDEMPW